MCSALVKFVPFAKEKNHFTAVIKRIFEVYEVIHKVANCVKYDILRQRFGNSHRLLLLFFLAWCRFTSPAFEIVA